MFTKPTYKKTKKQIGNIRDRIKRKLGKGRERKEGRREKGREREEERERGRQFRFLQQKETNKAGGETNIRALNKTSA